ncbi:MAG: hypothetical protein FVQ82_01395 [Planctomycetes bacterium]|nr:hypothetical protein [Planctomycetota bacterium]
MNLFNILAEAETPGLTTAVENDVDWVPVDFIWDQINTLSWFHAVLAISFGVVYLLYGWRIFKSLTVICFGLIGMFAGMSLGRGMGSEMWGGVFGLAILAILSVPLMKYCICMLGAIAGGILTGAIWYACELPQLYMWAGAATGAVAGGMISFIVFKIAVMLFTSLGGSTIMMSGILALLNLYQLSSLTPEAIEAGEQTLIKNLIFNDQWFLPVALLTPTLIGLILQHKFIRKSSEWEI